MPPSPHLDLFTVKAVTLVTVLTVSLVTLLAWRINRPVSGMRHFALGLFWICLGSVLGMSRLVIPGPAIIVAGNVLTISGMMRVTRGLREFRSFPPVSRSLAALFAGSIAGPFTYWMFVQDDFSKRVGVISFAMSLLAFDATVSMLKRVSYENRLTYWPTAVAFGFTAVFLGVRSVAGFTGHYGSDFLAPVPIEIPLSLCSDVAFVGCAFGMLLASNTQMRNSAERMARFDPLTNLPNRRVLVDRLFDAERRAVENNAQLGIVFLDLDGFKHVNDTLGHDVGDELLRRVSAAMSPLLRHGDCLARVGGDEFVAVVEGVQARSDLSVLAARLKSAVERQKIPGRRDETVQVSMGFAIFPMDGETAHDVMREADAAMYRAKRQRRSSVQITAVV
jgi:diguanylate cyclase (GGDEF)-like protein